MPYDKYPLLNREHLQTIPIESRHSTVHAADFAHPVSPGATMATWLDSLPHLMAGSDLRELVSRLTAIRQAEQPIVWGFGAHVIKVGLAPVIIDLMERGWISAIAANGAFMIHDFEIALAGATSEDVAAGLLHGTYGNTEETGLFLNLAQREGHKEGMGAGEAVGFYLNRTSTRLAHAEASVLYHAYRLHIPVTIHPAIGTDFIHFHPMFSGEVTGALAERDFTLLASIVARMNAGGAFLNVGSAVILPEVFMKAIACCTGQGITFSGITTAVFDFVKHYRPTENVVRRPTGENGRGFYFVGHHELMVPLLAAALVHVPA